MTPGGSPTPYIPNTDADRAGMLEVIGVADAAELFRDLPALAPIDLPSPLAEADLLRWLEDRAAACTPRRPSFVGAGAYRRLVPAVTAALASRPEFVTAYTPYQPEISQGTLQAAFEFQSVVCALTGLDVANTGLYDVASATAEAALLAARVTHRTAVAVLEPFHPHRLDVLRTYARGADLRIQPIAGTQALSDDHACVLVQQPDFLGAIHDVQPIADAAHEHGALCVVSADPLALGLLRAPGDAGADIVTGEGRDLAGPVQFGGPSLGLFAAREAYLRQMPGRIVGRTRELTVPVRPDGTQGPARTGFVLTLQAREQFIRRERATSNLSTGQSLVALAFALTLEALGPAGLRAQAELCYQRAHDAAAQIDALPGFTVIPRGPWFQEFLVRGSRPAKEVLRALAGEGIVGGYDLMGRPEAEARDAFLVCVTEATPAHHIDALVQALATIGSGDAPAG